MREVKRKKVITLGGEAGYTVTEAEAPRSKAKGGWGVALEVSEIGFSIAMPIVVGALFGLWLDEKLDSHPRATLSGIAIGIIVAFANLFQVIRKYSQKKS